MYSNLPQPGTGLPKLPPVLINQSVPPPPAPIPPPSSGHQSNSSLGSGITESVLHPNAKNLRIPPPTVPENKAVYRFFIGGQAVLTTVFVGNISDNISDSIMRQILQKCGEVSEWKRVQGASGKLQAFGFCEYSNQEDALRCLRILNQFPVGGKQLLVKVDSKTRTSLDQYEEDCRQKIKVNLRVGDISESQQLLNSRKDEDESVHNGIIRLLTDHDPCFKDVDVSKLQLGFNCHQNRESSSNDKNRSSSKHSRKDGRNNSRDEEGRNKSRTPTPSDEEAREDLYEKRRVERRKTYKENSYIERVKKWDSHVRKTTREFERDVAKNARRKNDQAEATRRLIEFLKNYDDDKDDQKYYSGSAWSRKLADRELELEWEHRDQLREREEKEEMERLALEEESKKGEEPNILDIHVNLPRLHELPEYQTSKNENGNIQPVTKKSSTGAELRDGEEEDLVHYKEQDVSRREADWPSHSYSRESESDKNNISTSRASLTFGIKKASSYKTQYQSFPQPVEEMFVATDEGVVEPAKKKVKLTKIDAATRMNAPSVTYASERAKPISVEERKRRIKILVDSIPTDKTALFAVDVKWFLVDEGLIEKKIKPWVSRKIQDYIGEVEPTLVKFICQKIYEKSSPKVILDEISMILDEEAEVFVVKLWRLLIYETEAKSSGLVLIE